MSDVSFIPKRSLESNEKLGLKKPKLITDFFQLKSIDTTGTINKPTSIETTNDQEKHTTNILASNETINKHEKYTISTKIVKDNSNVSDEDRYAEFCAEHNFNFRDLVKAPIFKSIFLTIVFGTAIVGLIDSRRELETLEQTYNSKFVILEEIIAKLEKGENVDIHRELKLVNKLTKNKYNTVTDIELDEQLDEILKMTESDGDEIRKESTKPETQKYDKSQIETNKFL